MTPRSLELTVGIESRVLYYLCRRQSIENLSKGGGQKNLNANNLGAWGGIKSGSLSLILGRRSEYFVQGFLAVIGDKELNKSSVRTSSSLNSKGGEILARGAGGPVSW